MHTALADNWTNLERGHVLVHQDALVDQFVDGRFVQSAAKSALLFFGQPAFSSLDVLARRVTEQEFGAVASVETLSFLQKDILEQFSVNRQIGTFKNAVRSIQKSSG